MTSWVELRRRDYGEFAEVLLDLRHLCRSGGDLIGLGEAVRFFEAVAEGDDEAEPDAALSISLTQGPIDERVILFVEIGDEGLEFGQIDASYDPEVGSDHSTKINARVPAHRFSMAEIGPWLGRLNEVRAEGKLELRVSRNHV